LYEGVGDDNNFFLFFFLRSAPDSHPMKTNNNIASAAAPNAGTGETLKTKQTFHAMTLCRNRNCCRPILTIKRRRDLDFETRAGLQLRTHTVRNCQDDLLTNLQLIAGQVFINILRSLIAGEVRARKSTLAERFVVQREECRITSNPASTRAGTTHTRPR
jgi:hypothetical protein